MSNVLNKILIYIPAFNEEETIARIIQSIPRQFPGFGHVEILVVNDGSSDATSSIALAQGAIVIDHKRNKGVGAAFQTALNYALRSNADIMVSIDADGQFDVGQIPGLILPIIEHRADFSTGNRFSTSRPSNMPRVKFWGNHRVNQIISFVSKTKIMDASCGFRAYSRDCLLSLNLQGVFTYTHETILDLLDKGFKIEQVPVSVKYFDGRVSRVASNVFSYGIKTSIIIFKCLKDYRPLQFFLSVAMVFFGFGFLLSLFAFVHWIMTGTITPYKSFGIIGLSLLGISIMLTMFAFMADMLGRIRKNQEKILYLLKKNESQWS